MAASRPRNSTLIPPARRERSRLTRFRAAALSSAYKVTSTVFACCWAAQLPPLFMSPVITAYPLMHVYVACRLSRLHVKTDVPAESREKVQRLSAVKHERKKTRLDRLRREWPSVGVSPDGSRQNRALCSCSLMEKTLLCCHALFLFFSPNSKLVKAALWLLCIGPSDRRTRWIVNSL